MKNSTSGYILYPSSTFAILPPDCPNYVFPSVILLVKQKFLVIECNLIGQMKVFGHRGQEHHCSDHRCLSDCLRMLKDSM